MTTKKKTDDTSLATQVKHGAALVALSPFRFPLDVEKLAIQTARLSGVAFVFIGALFTVFSLPGVESQLSFWSANTTENTAAITLANMSFNVQILLAAGFVIVLGLVLLLLGMHMRNSRLEEELKIKN